MSPKRSDRSQADRAAAAILQAADAVRRAHEAALAPHGLTGQQHAVLRVLRAAHPEPLPTLAIGERMLERNPGVTRLLDRLEAKGLVQRERREPGEGDRRLVRRALTAEGVALLERVDGPLRLAVDGLVRRLDRGDVKRLRQLAERVGERA